MSLGYNINHIIILLFNYFFMKQNFNKLIPIIKENLLWFILDESWEITKEDAMKLASATLLIAWITDLNAATSCVSNVASSCGC